MLDLVIAILIGLLVGVLSGLLGIGGGTIMVPVFRLIFGLEPIGATATSFFTIIPTSISGVSRHLRNHTCVLKLGLIAGVAGACLSPVGVLVASVSPGWTIMAATAVVILYSSLTMFRKGLACPKTGHSGKPAPLTPAEIDELQAQVAPFKGKRLAQALGIGAIAGFMGGFVGVGGGFIMVPLFISVLGVSMRLASGTSLVAVMLLAISGTIEQAVLGNISYVTGLAMACGSIPGALVGANLIKYIPERTLRFVFSGFLVVVAIILMAKELGFLG